MTGRLRLLLLLACPSGQLACAPLVYEFPGSPGDDTTAATEDHDPTDPHGDSDPSPTSTDPPDPTLPDTGEPGPPPTCGDGGLSGDETDVDCGGSCPPCGPGRMCGGPDDCAGVPCVQGVCGECQSPADCKPAGPCAKVDCSPEGLCVVFPGGDGDFCDDGDLCTVKDTCQDGKCQGFAPGCEQLDGPCRVGFCNPQTGNCAVEFVADGLPCEDGLDCTQGDQCGEGECVPGQPAGAQPLTNFNAEDGWTADPPWQIGKAVPSKCAVNFADDPADDNSPDFEMGLAGAAIGGCLPKDPFPKVCLTSPPFDPKGFPGPLFLRFWSVLNNADGLESSVEILAPKELKWTPVLVFQKFEAEPKWTFHEVDISGLAGPGMRVRFCHLAAAPIAPVGGWSLDDVSVGPPGCG